MSEEDIFMNNCSDNFFECPFCEDEIIFGKNVFDPENPPEFIWHPKKLF